MTDINIQMKLLQMKAEAKLEKEEAKLEKSRLKQLEKEEAKLEKSRIAAEKSRIALLNQKEKEEIKKLESVEKSRISAEKEEIKKLEKEEKLKLTEIRNKRMEDDRLIKEQSNIIKLKKNKEKEDRLDKIQNEKRERDERLNNPDFGEKQCDFLTNYQYSDFIEYTKRNNLTEHELMEHSNEKIHNVFGVLLRAGRAIIKREDITSIFVLPITETLDYYVEDDKGNIHKRKKPIEDIVMRTGLKTYQDVRFNPEFIGHYRDERVNQWFFNRWFGYEFNSPRFKVEKDDIDIRRVQGSLDYLKEVICNNNIIYFNYIVNWITHIIQRPHIKTKVCIFLHSNEFGTGKNSLYNFIKLLIGKGYCYASADAKVTLGHFNTLEENKLLICLDEGKPSDIHQHNKDMEIFKNKITEDEEIITPKGIDSYKAKSFSNFIYISNFDSSINIPHETERRFCCLSVNPKYAIVNNTIKTPEDELSNEKSREFFKNLYANEFSIENLPHIFSWFFNRTLDINICDIPETELRTKLLKRNKEQNKGQEFITYLTEGHFNTELENLYNPEWEFLEKKENKKEGTPAIKSMKYCIADNVLFNRIYKPHMISLGIKEIFITLNTFNTLMEQNKYKIFKYSNKKHTKFKLYNIDISKQEIPDNTDFSIIGRDNSSSADNINELEETPQE